MIKVFYVSFMEKTMALVENCERRVWTNSPSCSSVEFTPPHQRGANPAANGAFITFASTYFAQSTQSLNKFCEHPLTPSALLVLKIGMHRLSDNKHFAFAVWGDPNF